MHIKEAVVLHYLFSQSTEMKNGQIQSGQHLDQKLSHTLFLMTVSIIRLTNGWFIPFGNRLAVYAFTVVPGFRGSQEQFQRELLKNKEKGWY